MPSLLKTTALVIVLIHCSSYIFGQQHLRKTDSKSWKATVFCEGIKWKGILYAVTDTSLILQVRGDYVDEISFKDIHKIKLVRASGKGSKVLIGFVVGAGVGGWAGSSGLSKNREGEPKGMAGMIGAVGGSILGGITGAILGPVIYNTFTARKFIVTHDPASYNLLKIKLQPYSLKRD